MDAQLRLMQAIAKRKARKDQLKQFAEMVKEGAAHVQKELKHDKPAARRNERRKQILKQMKAKK